MPRNSAQESIQIIATRETERFSLESPGNNRQERRQPASDVTPEDAVYTTSAIPDGAYGWTIVFCCSLITFWVNGIINCWGVLQAALLNSTLRSVSTFKLSFVGSLAMASTTAFGLIVNRLTLYIGSRMTSIIGVLLMGSSLIGSSFCTQNIAGLFGFAGLMAGVGMAMVYAVSNALPVQYFSGRLGLANGLVKLGGGIGGCVLAIALEALNRRVGIAWTFRIQGLLTIGTGLPAAFLLKDRVPLKNMPFIDLSMFKSLPFIAIFTAGAIGTFALYILPYFLPLFA